MLKNEVFAQADSRSTDIWYDQWNRPWEVTLEHRMRNYGFGSHPIPRFKVPHPALYPDPHYITRGPRLGTLVIDTDRMLQDVQRSQKIYSEQLMSVVQRNFPSNALEVAQNPPPSLVQMLGLAPFPEAFVRAMRAGNSWVLGLSDKEPSWLTADLKAWLKAKTGQSDLVREALEDAKYADEGDDAAELLDTGTVDLADAMFAGEESVAPIKRGPGRPRKNPLPLTR